MLYQDICYTGRKLPLQQLWKPNENLSTSKIAKEMATAEMLDRKERRQAWTTQLTRAVHDANSDATAFEVEKVSNGFAVTL